MDHDEPVTVYTVKDPRLAEIVRIALEGEGIICRVGNEGQAGLQGLLDIDITVRAADAERARQWIESHESLEEDADLPEGFIEAEDEEQGTDIDGIEMDDDPDAQAQP